MKNYVLIMFSLLVLVACAEEELLYDRDLFFQQETLVIQEYLTVNNIEAEQHETGYFFETKEEGDGVVVEPGQIVALEMNVYGLDGTFYYSTDASLERSHGISIFYGNRVTWWIHENTIAPVQLSPVYRVARTFGEGARLQIFVPSRLGYGYEDYNWAIGSQEGIRRVHIPANTTLRVELEIVDIYDQPNQG